MPRKILIAILALAAIALAAGSGKPATVTGYVIDSACAYTKSLDKPISPACARKCARAGSPLVILADDGTIYWPIDSATPARGQNARLLPYAGKKVTATGAVHERGGSKAMVLEKLAAAPEPR